MRFYGPNGVPRNSSVTLYTPRLARRENDIWDEGMLVSFAN